MAAALCDTCVELLDEDHDEDECFDVLDRAINLPYFGTDAHSPAQWRVWLRRTPWPEACRMVHHHTEQLAAKMGLSVGELLDMADQARV